MHQLDMSAAFPSGAAAHALGAVTDCLRPATCGCPECQTMRMIASPAPPGDCPDCGTPLRIRQG